MQRDNADSVSGRTTGNSFSMLTHILWVWESHHYSCEPPWRSVKVCEDLLRSCHKNSVHPVFPSGLGGGHQKADDLCIRSSPFKTKEGDALPLRRFHWSCKTWKACPNSKVMSDEWLSNCCKHWDLARRQFESPVLNLEATFFSAGASDIFDFPGYALDDDPDEQTYWIILDGLKPPQQHWSFRWPWLTRQTFWSVLACGARQALFNDLALTELLQKWRLNRWSWQMWMGRNSVPQAVWLKFDHFCYIWDVIM